jgi:hypothetical protein
VRKHDWSENIRISGQTDYRRGDIVRVINPALLEAMASSDVPDVSESVWVVKGYERAALAERDDIPTVLVLAADAGDGPEETWMAADDEIEMVWFNPDFPTID